MECSYKEKFIIKCYEVDTQKNYKAFAFMNAAQEIAHIHSTQIGCGYYDLIKNNNVWVISRAHVKFIKAPKWEDMVTLETWNRREDGLFAIRDFEMTDKDGNPMIEATTSWLIMNMDSRRVQRTDHILGNSYDDKSNPKEAICGHCEKISAPDNLQFIGQKEIKVTDIDYNLHTNNAKYIEWTMDCLDIEILKSKAIDEFKISFNTESKIHDIIDLYHSKINDIEYYVEGKKKGKSVFQIIIKFK
ncbi:MAG: thioesterase [Bacteroidales bacterium]|nr:thioesterase [Bacteroidales bacterium]